VSDDGRYVAFVSDSATLVPGDENGVSDVFVRDRVAHTTMCASTDASGATLFPGAGDAALSRDGRYVAYISSAANPVPGTATGTNWLLIRDLATGSVGPIRVPAEEVRTTCGYGSPAMSADGRYVAFVYGPFTTYDPAGYIATLQPESSLRATATYTVTLSGGGGDAMKDLSGNAMASPVQWSFATGAGLPGEGPGGPILVVAAAGNPFTRYYAEILRAEGLNEFAVLDASKVTSSVLADYDVVILGEQLLTDTQVTMLSDWVNAGGNLVAMRPDARLAALLGLTPLTGTLADAYLRIDTSASSGAGLHGETI
jgi:hypothetical protein